MLYLAIPAHNEVATIGVLLWRIRTVLAEFPREYEVVVYDDASTDETAEVASQYEQAMPVTVLRGQSHLGYAGAVDALLRHVAQQTRYPRRDAVLLLQGDFTDPPGIVPEFARRFEGGADLVVGERLVVADAPVAVRRLFKGAHWAMRPFVRVDGVKDITASMRLVRISALRDALRTVGDAPLVTGDTWTANADLLLRLAPHARRVESVPMEPTYGVRMRETRRVAMRDALSALKWAWGARGRRATVGTHAEAAPDERKANRTPGGKRREEAPELSVERLREKVRERDGSRGLDGEPEKPRDKRRGRDRERPERDATRDAARDTARETARAERPERTERPEKSERPARTDAAAADRPAKPRRERPERGERSREERAPSEPRAPKAPRGERPARPRRDEPRVATTASLDLDDPFAPPTPKVDPIARALDAAPVVFEAEPPVRHADAPDLSDAPADAEAAVSRAWSAAPALPAREESAPSDDAELDGEDGGDEDAESGGDNAADGSAGDAPRKRRRNRRSRRGRRRRENADGSSAESADGASDGASDAESNGAAAGGESAVVDAREGRPVSRRPARDEGVADGEDDGGSESDGDGDADSEATGEDGAPRARRRGRRGRRGGARRSRGRRDRGDDGGGEGGGNDGGASGGEPSAGSDD